MTGGVANVASGGGGVIGAVVALATVGCRGWCIGCWWSRCSWFVGNPRPAVVVLVVLVFVEAVGNARGSWPRVGGGGAGECRRCHGRRCH